MKVLLNTCIVIDFLQNREPFAKVVREIFYMIAKENFLGCITAKSATDIYYLTHRCTHSDKEARLKLNQLLSILVLLDSMSDDILNAICSEVSDFEDAVMIETAVHSNMDCIITRNTKDYVKSPIPVYTPTQFVEIYERK